MTNLDYCWYDGTEFLSYSLTEKYQYILFDVPSDSKGFMIEKALKTVKHE